MPETHTERPRIVHIGAFDLASYGDQLYPLVSAHELGQRLDGAEVLPFGPLGSISDEAAPDGDVCWALGRWTTARAQEIAARATVVLCGGGEIVHGDGTIFAPFYGIDERDAAWLAMDRWFLDGLGVAEASCPTVWHAPGVPHELDPATATRLRKSLAERSIVAVRDERSRALLEAAGVDRTIDVVPDSALLLPRVLPPSLLDDERRRLMADGTFPEPTESGKVLVVQGNHTMTRLVDELAPALDQLPDDYQVVTLSVSPCHNDQLFAHALGEALTRQVWDVPPAASLEAIAAALAGADCLLGVSMHAAITAIAYGKPTVTLDPFSQDKLASFLDLAGVPERRTPDPAAAVTLAADLAARHRAGEMEPRLATLDGLQQRIDTHFDNIAELTVARHGSPSPVTWSDTGAAQQLKLRGLPMAVVPRPSTVPLALRHPDCDPTPDEVRTAVDEATEIRLAHRDADVAMTRELAVLRSENDELRGAIAHLEGLTMQLEDQIAEAELRRHPLDRIRRRLQS